MQHHQQQLAMQPSEWFTSTGGAGNTQYKIKKFIDDIYSKEMKYRYHRQYVREDYLPVKSPIFDLSKSTKLKQKDDLFKVAPSTKKDEGEVLGF